MAQRDLDTLLHTWLSETDEGKAGQRFTEYFRVAFPDLCRYLRSLRADEATAQDISQRALIKLFTHLGTARREGDARLRAALSGLQPLDFGALHVQRVYTWRQQVASFRAAAVGFSISDEQRRTGAWRQVRQGINVRTLSLSRQGGRLLSEVRERVDSLLGRLIGLERGTTAGSQRPSDEPAGPVADPVERETARFVAELLNYGAGRESDAVDAAICCPGALGFVTRTNTVCEELPTVAIPSNGLLYTIAKRQFLNLLRSQTSDQRMFLAVADETDTPGVLGEMDIDFDFPIDPARPMRGSIDAAASDPASDADDEARDIESRYQAFLEYLRAPLTRAEAALATAESAGNAGAQRAKVDSLSRKYQRLIAVLRALHDSPQPGEEEIAQRYGLSRNQVKYVIERVREEFTHFFPELSRATQGRRKKKGVET